MDVRLDWLLRTQNDLVAWWQLRAIGWSEQRIAHHLAQRGWRRIHNGVFACTRSPLTRRQRWLAATLTEPGTLLSHASAGACWGLRPWRGGFETVVRAGSGGPRRFDGVLVSRSRTLTEEIAWKDGIPLTSAERTIIDLSPFLGSEARGRSVREAIRLGVTDVPALREALTRHRGRRGVRPLRELAELYAGLPLHRTRSDAEGKALERYRRAGMRIPAINERVGRFEADFVDHERRLIVEVDGPQFHLFPGEDERRERAWRARGYRVVRRPSSAVYTERP